MSASAFAAEAASDPKQPLASTSETQAEKADDRTVCKTVTATGSRLGKKRVCYTRSEWAELTRRSRETVEETQRGAATNNCIPGNGC